MSPSQTPLERIALIGPVPPPAGGMAAQTEQLATLLQREGIAIELIAVNPPYPVAWLEKIKGVRALVRLLQYLPRLWRAAGRNQIFHVMANSGWSWHLFAAPAVWIAHWRRVPVLVNYRGGEAHTFFQRSWRWVAPTLRRCQSVIVPSGFLQDILARFGHAVTVIPNIVDLDRFQAAAPATSVSHLIIARNLEPIYGIDTALHAFAIIVQKYPVARLSIAGDGPQQGHLEQLAAQLGLTGQVTFVGRLNRRQMIDFYQSATLMLNPSRVDNMPNSILEAWACGVPVVSTNVGGIPFIASDHENALLVAPDQPAALAHAVCTLLGSPTLRATLRINALTEVRRYDWPAVRQQWLDCYRNLIT